MAVLESLPSRITCTEVPLPAATRRAKSVGMTRAIRASRRVDGPLDLPVVVRMGAQGEIAGAGEAADQFPAGRGAALVPDDEGNPVHVEGQGVAEEKKQDHGNGDPHAETARVAEDMEKFLFGYGLDAVRFHKPVLFNPCIPAAALPAGHAPR